MFDNLVESKVHSDDLARKSSFFLGTVLIYGAVLTAIFIGSIVWVTNNIEQENYELLAELDTPVTPDPPQVQQPEETQPKPAPTTTEQQVATRIELIADTNTPTAVPKEVVNVASKVPSVPPGMPVTIGRTNTNPTGSSGPVSPGGSGTGAPVVAAPPAAVAPPPPPPPKPEPPKAPPKAISKGVLNGSASSKYEPPYPPQAKAVRAQGAVNVQVKIDTTGKVVSATAVSGHPLLRQAAQQAALRWRFTPTQLSGQPVEVTGTITFNFRLD